MRISHCEIVNYRGIHHAQIDAVGDDPLVTISGQNGTGKSLILNALKSYWTGNFQGFPDSGPWENFTKIDVAVTLTDEEFEACIEWAPRLGLGFVTTTDERTFKGSLRFDKRTGLREDQESTVPRVLKHPTFQENIHFATLDYLPAVRHFPMSSTPSVDLSLLSTDAVRNERSQINQRSQPNELASFPNISTILASLDYEFLLNKRQGISVDDDYQVLQSAFLAATGKKLLRPAIDEFGRNSIRIELPSGHQHRLEDLSSGEQGMLGMLFYIRRLSASGGVLLIDEPEQHLHPTLQAALFEVVQGIAERAQVWAVTHSPKLLSAAPPSGAFQMRPPSETDANQVHRLQDEPSRRALISELGITTAALLQSDLLLVVEGETDSKWLRELLPVELGRAHVLVAGSGKDVVTAHKTLAGSPLGIPWLCIIDRDLMDDDQVATLSSRYENLHVWPFREIESLFLDIELIYSTLRNAGYSVTKEEVRNTLLESVMDLQGDVVYEKTQQRLNQLYPAPETDKRRGKYKQLEEYLRAYAITSTEKADALESVRAQVEQEVADAWATDWPRLADPKAVLGRIHARFRCFSNVMNFKDALTARVKLDKAIRPEALVELQEIISSRID
ncbi:AAA family ATPase [Streptomyces collinus]|uniref:ATP-dependent nuclease n=1 Tax=Streptomyces collinus TaxID=42684 RepID=UPI0036E8F2AE